MVLAFSEIFLKNFDTNTRGRCGSGHQALTPFTSKVTGFNPVWKIIKAILRLLTGPCEISFTVLIQFLGTHHKSHSHN